MKLSTVFIIIRVAFIALTVLALAYGGIVLFHEVAPWYEKAYQGVGAAIVGAIFLFAFIYIFKPKAG